MRQRIDVEEAAALVLATMPRWEPIRVPLAGALGTVLREPLVAERDQPPFDRVTMDGIAFAGAAFAAGQRRFRVAGTQGAGSAALTLAAAGDCIEVMTGCVLPTGTDTVVPVERIRREGDAVVIEDGYQAVPRQFVHPLGSDHRQGALLLGPGTRIGPAEMAILTIGGSAEVAVTRRPRIAVISTGDELIDAGQPIASYQIRSSNDRALEAALRQRGFGDVSRCTLRDDPALLGAEIGRLHRDSDLVILSGGVSMGQFDHVPATLVQLGVEPVFHKVLQRPGLPLWFGRSAGGKVVFALPGNPISSLVCLVRYVLPGIDAAMGAAARPVPRVRLAEALEFRADLTAFVPVTLAWSESGDASARPKPTNTSGDFVALGGTDGFVELPRGQQLFPAGYPARFYAW